MFCILYSFERRERKTKTTNPLNQKYYRYKNNNILYRKRISSTHVRALPAMQYHIYIYCIRDSNSWELRVCDVCIVVCMYLSLCASKCSTQPSHVYIKCIGLTVAGVLLLLFVFGFFVLTALSVSLSCWLSVLCFAFACVCVCVCYWPFAFNAIYYE